jgi:hypothetical protein
MKYLKHASETLKKHLKKLAKAIAYDTYATSR